MLLIHFEPVQLLQLLTSTVFPLLVGLVTTRDTRPGRRAVLLAALSVLSSLAAGLLGALQAGDPFDLISALLAAVGSFVIAVGLHYGLWTHTGLPAVLQNVTVPGLGAALTASRDREGITGRHAATGPAPAPAAIPGTIPISTAVTARHDVTDPACIRYDPERLPLPGDPAGGCRLCPQILPAAAAVIDRAAP
jgi:hypothetical protein